MTTLQIQYCAMKNIRREPNGTPRGWVPMIFVNGVQQGNPYDPWGRGEAQAEREAKELALAEAEAARVDGDWDTITVSKRESA